MGAEELFDDVKQAMNDTGSCAYAFLDSPFAPTAYSFGGLVLLSEQD
jgi:hypothetical protein